MSSFGVYIFVVDLRFQLLRLVQVIVQYCVGQSVLFDRRHVAEYLDVLKESIPVHLPWMSYTQAVVTSYVFEDFCFTLWVFMRSWLNEIHIPYPDLTLPSGLNVYLGIDSVRDK